MFASIVLVVLVIFCYLISKFLHRNKKFWKCLDELPQPPHYPIVGNLFDLTKSPDKIFDGDKKRGLLYYPIYKLDVLGVGSANVLNPEDTEIILKNSRHNTKSVLYDFLHSWLGQGLLTSTGSKWRQRRKILTPAFHFNILKQFVEVFVEKTEILVKDLENYCNKTSSIDILSVISRFTLSSIAETAMGIDLSSYQNDETSYKLAIHEIGRLLVYRASRPWMYSNTMYSLTSNSRKEKEIVKVLHIFSHDVITKRKENSPSKFSQERLAMLDLLLKYKEEGAKIDDEGIREEVDTFMFEGHDTTAIAICFVLLVLANEKRAQDEIYEEIQEILGDDLPTYNKLVELKFMERCIKETLRLYPSVPLISRISGDDIKTKTGFTIPNHCMINIRIYDMHHNPNVWPDPEKFDPDRFLPENISKRHPFAYLPFSAGPRNCIGQKFAMLEMKTVLCGILKNFFLEAVDKPEDIVFMSDLVLRPKSEVRVKFVPRKL